MPCPRGDERLRRLENINRDDLSQVERFTNNRRLEKKERSLTPWNASNSDYCSWGGVQCDAKSGEVISLVLDKISLNGSLKSNSSLFKLQHLRHLTLSACDLRGEIPSSLGNLSHLTNLDISGNHLIGEVPSSICSLTQLTLLSLSRNNLSGSIPISFANFNKLSFLLLDRNQFSSGDFPRILPNLTSLSKLDLSNIFVAPQVMLIKHIYL